MNSTIQNMFFDGIYTTTVNRTLTQNYFLKNIPIKARSSGGLLLENSQIYHRNDSFEPFLRFGKVWLKSESDNLTTPGKHVLKIMSSIK